MSQSTSKLFSVSISVLRFLLPAWIGAAVLFVITSVAEQTAEDFGSVIRDQLATIRFPLYYKFGTVIYIGSLLACAVAWKTSAKQHGRRATIILLLMVVSAIVFAWDYFTVYSPLQALIIPPGQVRTQEFITLHNWSRHANELHLMITLAACVLALIPFTNGFARAPVAGTGGKR